MKGLLRSLSRGSPQRQEVYRVNLPINTTVNVAAAGAGVGFGSAVIGGLPQGNLLFLGAVAYVQLAGPGDSANITDTWNGDFGIGTTPATDGTITAGDTDIISSTAVGPAVAEESPLTRGISVLTEGLIFNNTDGSLELNLNVLVDAADITDAQNVDLTATGILHAAFIVLGDD